MSNSKFVFGVIFQFFIIYCLFLSREVYYIIYIYFKHKDVILDVINFKEPFFVLLSTYFPIFFVYLCIF